MQMCVLVMTVFQKTVQREMVLKKVHILNVLLLINCES